MYLRFWGAGIGKQLASTAFMGVKVWECPEITFILLHNKNGQPVLLQGEHQKKIQMVLFFSSEVTIFCHMNSKQFSLINHSSSFWHMNSWRNWTCDRLNSILNYINVLFEFRAASKLSWLSALYCLRYWTKRSLQGCCKGEQLGSDFKANWLLWQWLAHVIWWMICTIF